VHRGTGSWLHIKHVLTICPKTHAALMVVLATDDSIKLMQTVRVGAMHNRSQASAT